MADRSQRKKFSTQGFTLIELAMVLVIVGIVIGLGSNLTGLLMSATRVRETRDSLEANMQAIAAWASANNRLPPLIPIAPDSAGFGNTIRTPNDAWVQPYLYLYDANLAPTGTTSPTKDTICGRRSTLLSLMDSKNPAATITNVAYLLLSPGDDNKTSSTMGGVAVTSGGLSVATVINADSSNDIVAWVTLDELRSKIGCQGAPLKIVNNELPYIPQSTAVGSNIFTISADGGVPLTGSGNYTWCLEFAPRTGLSLFDTTPAGGIKGAGTCWGLPAASFVQGTQLSLQKKATFGNFTTGSYQVTIFARDGAAGTATTESCSGAPGDNCVRKLFVLTINPN